MNSGGKPIARDRLLNDQAGNNHTAFMMDGIGTILTIIIAWHLFWLIRFGNCLPDTDYGHFAYYGYFAARNGNWRILTGLPVWIGFKPGVYYLMAAAFLVFRSWSSPRILFALWNSLAAFILYLSFPQTGMGGVILYLVLSTAPYLGACYLQGEFWALLPTSAMIALSMASGFKGSGVLFGLLLMINPVAFKITYAFESLVFLCFYPGDRLEMMIGVLLFALITIAGLIKTRVFHGTIHAIRTFNFITYFLRYGRKAKINPRSLLTFGTELAPQLASLFLLVLFSDGFLRLLIIAALLGALIQFRFYRYHFVPTIPVMAVLAAKAEGPLVWLAIALPLLLAIRYWIPSSVEHLDALMNHVIVHYHKRNVASYTLSGWLRRHGHPSDKILIIGDTPQLHILSDRMSSNYYLDFDPNAVDAAPELAERLIVETIENPPEFIVMMIGCLNWAYLERRTGLRYMKVYAVQENDEEFPVYRKVGEPGNAAQEPGKLFHGCRYISADGRKIWNKINPPETNLSETSG